MAYSDEFTVCIHLCLFFIVYGVAGTVVVLSTLYACALGLGTLQAVSSVLCMSHTPTRTVYQVLRNFHGLCLHMDA